MKTLLLLFISFVCLIPSCALKSHNSIIEISPMKVEIANHDTVNVIVTSANVNGFKHAPVIPEHLRRRQRNDWHTPQEKIEIFKKHAGKDRAFLSNRIAKNIKMNARTSKNNPAIYLIKVDITNFRSALEGTVSVYQLPRQQLVGEFSICLHTDDIPDSLYQFSATTSNRQSSPISAIMRQAFRFDYGPRFVSEGFWCACECFSRVVAKAVCSPLKE